MEMEFCSGPLRVVFLEIIVKNWAALWPMALPTLQWRESIYQEKSQDSVNRLEIWVKMDFFLLLLFV